MNVTKHKKITLQMTSTGNCCFKCRSNGLCSLEGFVEEVGPELSVVEELGPELSVGGRVCCV